MTDIELLPPSVAAFVEALKGERGSLDAWLEVNNEREVAAHVEAYARAVAEHNVAERDAEIEALRAEVAAWEGLHVSEVQLRQRWQARAERLAEALRMMVENADDLVAYRHDEDDIGDRPCCQVASYEPHADHCPTHIARAALRDHDQEVGND